MCTAIVMKSQDQSVLLGRTMDFSFALAPQLFHISAGKRLESEASGQAFTTQYSYMGYGQMLQAPTLADGVNEAGFGAAVLYFPGYAQYDTVKASSPHAPCVASYEVVSHLLGTCQNTKEAMQTLSSLSIVGLPDPVTGTIAPFHWLLADASGHCVTAEKTALGLHFYENRIGVLANSPDFGWHMTHLRSFIPVVPQTAHETVWADSVALAPFGQGSGTFGLPGDFTSPSRFVRAAWLKSYASGCTDSLHTLRTGFRILESVSIPKGCVITERGTEDYTQYIVFYNLSSPEAFFRSYDAVPEGALLDEADSN